MVVIGKITETERCFSVEWKIENFSIRLRKFCKEFISPRFQFSGASWYFKVRLNKFVGEHASMGAICLCRDKEETHTESDEYFYVCTLSLKTSAGSLYKTEKFIYGKPGYEWFGLSSLEKSRVDAETQTPLEDADFRGLSEDFRNLFSSEENTDVTVKVKGCEFRVHSQILAARSPVFAPMFKHDMKEKSTGVVDIPDCDPGAFRILLVFLYSGRVDGLSQENVMHLYSAAHKYQVTVVKTHCVDLMKQIMSEETVCDFLSFAVMHGDQELITHSTDFFVLNAENICSTIKWMSFVKEHPVESNELTLKAFKFLSTK